MYDATFFHCVSKVIYEERLQEAARRYAVRQASAARPAHLRPQLGALRRHLRQAL